MSAARVNPRLDRSAHPCRTSDGERGGGAARRRYTAAASRTAFCVYSLSRPVVVRQQPVWRPHLETGAPIGRQIFASTRRTFDVSFQQRVNRRHSVSELTTSDMPIPWTRHFTEWKLQQSL